MYPKVFLTSAIGILSFLPTCIFTAKDNTIKRRPEESKGLIKNLVCKEIISVKVS